MRLLGLSHPVLAAPEKAVAAGEPSMSPVDVVVDGPEPSGSVPEPASR